MTEYEVELIGYVQDLRTLLWVLCLLVGVIIVYLLFHNTTKRG
jgi:hypothetical protein